MADTDYDKSFIDDYMINMHYSMSQALKKTDPENDMLMFFRSVIDSVISSKKIIIGEKELALLHPTKTKNEIYDRNIPFPNILICNDIKIKNKIISGIYIYDIKYHYDRELLPEGMLTNNIYIIMRDEHSQNHSIYAGPLGEISPESYGGIDTEIETAVKIFVCNIIDFLNDPDVELINYERSNKQIQRRLERGKKPIHSHSIVRVTGKLKLYLDRLSTDRIGREYHYRFWVRGHFRTLRKVERYHDRAGSRVWIPPYIKGQGLLIEKNYLIENKGVKQ